MSTATFERALSRPSFNLGPVGVALTLIVLGEVYLTAAVAWRQGVLFLVGAGAGVVLYHAAFGFTSSWRALIAEKRGDGLRAQMLMLALTCTIFLPVLARGHIFGQPVRGAVSPVGLSVIVGAFLFGVGMQLGGGCASGTLYTAGGGSVRMLVTLAAFVAGSVLGALHMPLWQAAPALEPISLVSRLGLAASLTVSLLLFGAVALVSLVVERRYTGFVWTSLGNHVCVRLVGIESARSRWRGRGGMALLAVGYECRLAARQRPYRRHLCHGFRYHSWRVDGCRPSGPVCARLAGAAKIDSCGGGWWADARLWRPHRVRLQHWCLLQRHRLIQCSRLALVCRCVSGQRSWHADASALRAASLTDRKSHKSKASLGTGEYGG